MQQQWVICLWFSFFMASSAHSAELYRWTDSNGALHFSDHAADAGAYYQAQFSAAPVEIKTPSNAIKKPVVSRSGKKPTRSSQNSKTSTTTALHALPIDCQLIQDRINTLQRLMDTQRDPAKSAYAPEHAQRKKQWQREQCAKGGVFPHRELTESRRAGVHK